MAPTRPNVVPVQDMPPKGGYPLLNFARNARPRGPSGLMIWASVITVMGIGWYKVGQTNKKIRYDRKEQREARMAIACYLMVEEDRKYSVELKEQYALEAEIMKDVPGWEVGQSTYSKRWNFPIKKF